MATAVPTNSFGNLTDPTAWMTLVKNPTQLKAWLKTLAPKAPDELLTYYATEAIPRAPGANATEQAGSADYWSKKFLADPKALAGGTVLGGAITGGAGGADGNGRARPPGAPIEGTAVIRGTQLGGNAGDTYGAAYLAAQLQRRKSQAGGRGSTILAGFAPGVPATRPATALGGY